MFKFFKNIMNSISSQASWSPNYFDNYYLIHCNISMINFKKKSKIDGRKNMFRLAINQEDSYIKRKKYYSFSLREPFC